jgi:hypothetical protein
VGWHQWLMGALSLGNGLYRIRRHTQYRFVQQVSLYPWISSASGRNCEYSGVQLLIPGYPCKSTVDLLPSFNPLVHCPSPTCADYLTRDPSTGQPTDNFSNVIDCSKSFLNWCVGLLLLYNVLGDILHQFRLDRAWVHTINGSSISAQLGSPAASETFNSSFA